MRIPIETVRTVVKKAFIQAGIDTKTADLLARIHTESSADGVESHGLNRVPRFIQYVRDGMVDAKSSPELIKSFGSMENYDGHMGIGIKNAFFCSDRAVELAAQNGMGFVSIRNTTHWMRGGTYAWNIAEKGYIGISWINTESCMPLWGSDEPGVGNNPFCIGIPRKDGPIVLDMAMSQYSFGKIGSYRLAGKNLPYPGGFDADGNLSDVPSEIEATKRVLPTGYWKGSGMALCLDIAAAVLANGNLGIDIDAEHNGSCGSCCQVFLAFNPYVFGLKPEIDEKIERRVESLHRVHSLDSSSPVSYPGERTLRKREQSKEFGVVVDDTIWNQILMASEGNFDFEDISAK